MKQTSNLKIVLFFAFAIGFVACGFQKNGNGENFDRFYAKFHEDSLFQMERTEFPLKGEASYLEPNGKQIKFWYADNWLMQKTFDPTDTLGYEQNMISVDTMVVDVIYDGNAQGITRYFSLRDGKWYLTFYSDYNAVNPAFVEEKKK
jgi:hypothetical protein